MYELWVDKLLMAAETWVRGPIKPRHKLEEQEIPPEDVVYNLSRIRG
jgi:hypothetical protein